MARGEGWRPIIAVLALLSVLALPQGAAADPPPLAAFAGLPAFTLPQLSPDGTRYAALEPEDGKNALVIHDLAASKDAAAARLVLARADDAVIEWFTWMGDDRLIYMESFASPRDLETKETRLYAVPARGGRSIRLPNERAGPGAQRSADLIAIPGGDTDHLLVNLDRDATGLISAYSLDIRDGSVKRLAEGNRNTAWWLADAGGVVRLRVDIRDKMKEIYLRDGAEDRFRLILRYEVGKDPDLLPLAFDPDRAGHLIVAANGPSGRLAVYSFDSATGAMGPALFAHSQFDIEDVLTGDGRILGYSYRDDLPVTVYIDHALAARQAAIDRALPDTANPVVSTSADGRRALILANGPRDPGTLYLLDAPNEAGRIALKPLGKRHPALTRDDLGTVKPWHYRSRDGLDISAYLTSPSGMTALAGAGKAPLIVLVHGGPGSRDDMSFNFMLQFLASRGYRVMQANFRGSSGFGRDFEGRAVGGWGRAMIDDLTDGVQALIARGLIDPARICVVGTSYGGYAALMSVARNPGLYRCAASIGGPTDLSRFVDELADYRFATMRARSIAASAADGDFDAISPLAQADRITVPVLLVHGEDDRVVLPSHSRRMARALRRAGHPPELVMVEGADHGFNGEPQRRLLLQSLEDFLAKSIASGS